MATYNLLAALFLKQLHRDALGWEDYNIVLCRAGSEKLNLGCPRLRIHFQMSLQHRLAYRTGKFLSGLQSWAPTSSTGTSPCTQELRKCICIDECRQFSDFTVWPPQMDSCCTPGATACPEGLIEDRLDHLSKQHCTNEMLTQPAESWFTLSDPRRGAYICSYSSE